MKVPYSWLKDYVDIDLPASELAEKLFSCGFEVEEIVYLGEKINRVVVGEVTALTKHPDSDHMYICTVDCGEQYGRAIQIVTGAPNVYVGMRTPVALDNSTVAETNPAALEKCPDGVKRIKKGKLRGVESCGMLCSGEELGINDDFYEGAEVYGLLDLKGNPPLGEDIKKTVGLDDYIFDISVTANRPDCQCVFGIAREVAAITRSKLKTPDVSFTEYETSAAPVTLQVLASDLCPRYIGRYVEGTANGAGGADAKKTPAWMRKRLALAGLRSISPLVDITNFVLLELGQPMHAFDADELAGRKIVVRRAAEGEKIVTLDEKEFTLTPENLVICDGEKPVALAGIMGGLNSEIKATTKNVFFEAAKFARDNIRKTSRKLGQSSDSSARFEKGVDAYTSLFAMNRALHLTEQLGCGRVTAIKADENAEKTEEKTITASLEKIDALLGIAVPVKETEEILTRLNFRPKIQGDTLTVTVPGYREDVENYPDLAEEIIRSYGYSHLTPTFLKAARVTGGGLNDAQKCENAVKETLCNQGFYEAYNYSFYSPKDFDLMRLPADAKERAAVRVLNPITEDLSIMRTFLAPSMLHDAVRNIRRGNDAGKLFEYARVYLPETLPVTAQPEEAEKLGLCVWGNEYDFFDVKGAVEAIERAFYVTFSYERADKPYLHPGISANIFYGKELIGEIGELDPAIASALGLDKRVCLGELNMKKLLPLLNTGVRFTNLPPFPAVKRDLALIADESVTCAQLQAELLRSCKYVTKAELFDVYRGGQIPEGKKSMAFTVTFTPDSSAEKAFTGEATDNFVKKILGALKFKLGVTLR